jgi:hypothetical protein
MTRPQRRGTSVDLSVARGVTADQTGIRAIWKDLVVDDILANNGMVSLKDFVTVEDAEAIRQDVLAEAGTIYKLDNLTSEDIQP